MARKILIDGSNVVANIILADDNYSAPEGYTAIDDPGGVQIGSTYSGGEFTAPAPPVPATVTKLQLVRALRDQGLYDSLTTAIAAADTATQDTWACMTQADRSDPLTATLGAALGKSDADIDALFILAASL